MNRVKRIALSALLLASIIILSRLFTIRTPILSIGFSFVPVMLSGVILGARYTVLINVLADVIGALFFPSGAFFIGFTVSAACSGLIYGLLLHTKGKTKVDKKFVWRLILASVLVLILVHGVMNTVWVAMITGNAANIIAPMRAAKQLIMLPIQVGVMAAIVKIFGRQMDEMKNDRIAED